jgi:AAA-like domain/CHAT domain
MNKNSVKKILILAANPRDLVRLNLDEEVSQIRTTLQLSANRDRFAIEHRGGVRPDELQKYMYEVKPEIVHISAHGVGGTATGEDLTRKFTVIAENDAQPEGLMFEDDNGRSVLVSGIKLSNLCALFKEVECVVLNACYSQQQAQEIVKHIPYVVGMKQAIGDIAARKFSQGFYRAIWDGRSIEEAFASGLNAMDLANIDESLTPVLLKSSISDRVPPIPANLEEPGSLVSLNSAFYIERPPVEGRCYEAVASKGALIRIKAPRLMGKSSLMLRVLERSTQLGYRTVKLELGLADNSLFNDLDRFLRWFCVNFGKQLGWPKKINEYWDDELQSSKSNCTNYFATYLLKVISAPIVLILDKVDRLFTYPIAGDFFGLLRAWHEMSKSDPLWEKLRLIVVYSQEPKSGCNIDFDINQSPFGNVGVGIELSEFNLLQVKDLHIRYGLRWSHTELEELMAMVGGHPYLIRVALDRIARQAVSFRQLLNDAPTEAGVYNGHLRKCFDCLKNNNLLTAMQEVVATDNLIRLPVKEAYQLYSIGLISRQENYVVPRCNLYRLYFRDRLGVNI